MNQPTNNSINFSERRMFLLRSAGARWEHPLREWQLSNTVTGEKWDFQTNANQIKPKLELHACILMQWI